MKRLVYLIPVLLTFLACNNNYQLPSVESSDFTIEKTLPSYSSPKDAAPEIARTFVKRNFSVDCYFDSDVVLENTMVTNRFKVMQKFKKKGLEYVFKIYIQYFEGAATDVSSWDFNQIIVEEVDSGKRFYFKGNLDSRIKETVGIGNTVKFAGIDFKIIDARIETSIAFSHKEKLSRKQIANALKEMHDTYQYKSYHIYHDNNLKEDYIEWTINFK